MPEPIGVQGSSYRTTLSPRSVTTFVSSGQALGGERVGGNETLASSRPALGGERAGGNESLSPGLRNGPVMRYLTRTTRADRRATTGRCGDTQATTSRSTTASTCDATCAADSETTEATPRRGSARARSIPSRAGSMATASRSWGSGAPSARDTLSGTVAVDWLPAGVLDAAEAARTTGIQAASATAMVAGAVVAMVAWTARLEIGSSGGHGTIRYDHRAAALGAERPAARRRRAAPRRRARPHPHPTTWRHSSSSATAMGIAS